MFQLETSTEVRVTSVRACVTDGCGRPMLSSFHGLCRPHYDRKCRTGVVGGFIKPKAPHGKGHVRHDGYLVLSAPNGGKKLAHVAVAEAALGKPLPANAEVHHVDENPRNNDPSNLVICPDAAYHKLLHQRQRAFDACGHYDWRKCQFCGRYDEPASLWTSRKKACHRACGAAARRAHNNLKVKV